MVMAGLLIAGLKGLVILIVGGQITVVLYVLLCLLARTLNPGRDFPAPPHTSRPYNPPDDHRHG